MKDIIIDLTTPQQKTILDTLLDDDDTLMDYVYRQHDSFFDEKVEDKLRSKIASEYQGEIQELEKKASDKSININFFIANTELPKIKKLKHLWYLNFKAKYIYRNGYLCKIDTQIEYLAEFFKEIDFQLCDLSYFQISTLEEVKDDSCKNIY